MMITGIGIPKSQSRIGMFSLPGFALKTQLRRALSAERVEADLDPYLDIASRAQHVVSPLPYPPTP